MMKFGIITKRFYRSVSIALAGAMLCCCLTGFAGAQELAEETDAAAVASLPFEAVTDGDFDTGYDMAGNLNGQNYVRWTSPVYSHMYATDDGYMKVNASDAHVYIAKYDKSLKYVADSGLDLVCELPIFGGFYAGIDGNYYIAFGQENLDEDNDTEVIRVVKYDSSFKRLGSARIYGANTNIPFKSGSLRMSQKGNFLYIRTAHRMYKSKDTGQNHQANMTFEIETSSMEVLDIQSEVSTLSDGYVSHSFDQYIMVDDADNIITLDHGDAHPRSIVLGKYGTMAGNTNFSTGGFKYNEIFPIMGTNASNASGVALGGLEYSSKTYIAAGSSVAQDDSWSKDNEFRGRNVFVSIVDRSDISKSKILWLTNYKTTDEVFASVPQLVKLSDTSFMLLWNEIDTTTEKANGKYHYMLIDQDGAKKSEIGSGTGYVTDCPPVANADGSVTWFTYDGKNQFFYGVDKDLKSLDPVMDTAKEAEFKEIKYDGSEEEKKSGDSGSDKDDDGKKSSSSSVKEKDKDKEEAQRAADMENAAVSENGRFYVVRGSKAYLDGAKKVKKDKTYKVEYSPEKIVKLNAKGYVAGKAEGNCTIKLVSQGKTLTYKVTVVEPEVSKKLYVNKGESAVIPIKAKVMTGKYFISSNPESVEVSEVSGNGVVKAKDGKGAKVSYTIGTKKYKISVVVCSQEIAGKETVAEGKTLKLKLTGGAPGETKWESSNKSVATVDEKGVVTALKKGKVTISATNNGKTVTKKITVE